MDLIYRNASLQKTQPQVLRLRYDITGAKAVAEIVPGGGALVSFDAITQATLDAFGSLAAAEVDADNFDSTAMGNDVFGGVVDMGGQAAKLVRMTARCYSATNTVVTRQCQAAGLTASTLATELGLTVNGNIMFRVDFGNTPDFDGLTDGTIEIDIEWISK